MIPARRDAVLFVLPTAWDRRQLVALRATWQPQVDVLFAVPADEDCPWSLDPRAHVEELAARFGARIQGVASSSDYPGAAVAALLARRLGLPGPSPRAVLTAQHKFRSRLVQQSAVPDSVPGFAYLDPDRLPRELALDFPLFVKPVKGSFSLFARRMESRAELDRFFARPAIEEYRRWFLRIYSRMLEAECDFDDDGTGFLAEECLTGELVTVEGWIVRGEVRFLGIVDSIVDPRTKSFLRFDYPSRYPDAVQARMRDIAARVVVALGLDATVFNLEMAYDAERDRISIIEVNPRMCGQFADLYEKVDGVNGYEVALALARGVAPALEGRRGQFGAAFSLPIRVFEPTRVVGAPSERERTAFEAERPGTLLWLEVESGQVIDDLAAAEDGASVRCAVLNAGAASLAEVPAIGARLQSELPLVFEPLVR